MYKVYLLPVARRNIRQAAGWYDEQLPGLGKRYRDTVRKKVNRIKNNPYLYTIAYENIRIAIVPGFPYVIYYFIKEGTKEVFITAIPHTSQNIHY